MRALAFDTSTDACSVALAVDGETLEDHRVERQAHARLLLPMIEGLLAEAGLAAASLDAVAFGRGPGSFTGVRIAAAAAQGLAFAADVGVVGVSTLAAVAQGCLAERGDRHSLVVVDARMGELYVGEYRAAGPDAALVELVGEEAVTGPDAAGIDAVAATGAAFAGSGIERFPGAFARVAPDRLRPESLPRASDLLALAAPRIRSGALDDAAGAIPVYLRDRVALTEAERGTGQGGAR